MRIKTIIYTLVVLFHFSCSVNKQNEIGIKTIQLEETNQMLPLSSFADNISYIEFDFPDDSYRIGEIKNLKLIENDIIVKQRQSRKTSYLKFTKGGKFKNEIGLNQKGNDMLLNPKDIVPFKGGYVVWDQSALHAISKAGDYKEKLFDVHLPGNSLAFCSDKFYLFNELASHGYLCQYSTDGTFEGTYLPGYCKMNKTVDSHIAHFRKDSLHLYSPVLDTIYSFSNELLIPKYKIESSNYPTLIQTYKTMGQLDERETMKYLTNNRHVVVGMYLENKNYIFLEYRVGSDNYNLLIRKQDWDLTYFRACANDIDGGIWETPMYLSNDDVLYIPLRSYRINSHVIKNKKNRDFSKIQERMQGDDNKTVIMQCKLK